MFRDDNAFSPLYRHIKFSRFYSFLLPMNFCIASSKFNATTSKGRTLLFNVNVKHKIDKF